MSGGGLGGSGPSSSASACRRVVGAERGGDVHDGLREPGRERGTDRLGHDLTRRRPSRESPGSTNGTTTVRGRKGLAHHHRPPRPTPGRTFRGTRRTGIAIPDRILEVLEDRADPAALVTLHGLGVLGTDSAVCCPDAFSTSHHSHSGRPGHDETHDRVLAARSRRRRPAPADRRRRCPARSTVSVERAAALIRGE